MDLFRKKPISQGKTLQLSSYLGAFDLILMGMGAVIGAGIFVMTGIVAATQTGPAIVLAYLIAGFAAACSALSYAELSTSVGGCGSAYTYAYAAFGEIIAWVVGWDLILEYAISVSAIAVGWSGYLHDALKALSIPLPADGFNGLAFSIVALLTLLLTLGVKASSRFNNLMVFLKVAVLGLFIVFALKHVNSANWQPFMPFGWSGVIKGSSLIFFAYIGFDALATTAEETRDPMRNLPIGIIGSLSLCTLLYIMVAGLLTGIVPYKSLNGSSPISHAMLTLGHASVASLISVGVIAGLTTVMLVLFYGLTRVFFALARDGLLPQVFAHTSTRSKAPVRVIVISGLFIAILAGYFPINALAELVNIGTLFAFIVVSIGVMVLRYQKPELPRPFKTPWMPLIPCLGIISCSYLILHLPWLTILRFIVWMVIGLFLYFLYGCRHSKLLRIGD